VAPEAPRHASSGRTVIGIDAGLAFGGGDHPSSFLCLRALGWLTRFRQFRRVLDVGVGSGLLSIEVLKTWPAQVTAFDVNPFVTAKAQQYIRANHVAPRVRVSYEAGGKAHRLPRGTRFELALVNLNYAELAAYAPALARAALPGGMVLLSGLGTYHERYVAAAYAAHGFALRNKFRQDGWSSLVMQARRAKCARGGRRRRPVAPHFPNLRCSSQATPSFPVRLAAIAGPSPVKSIRAAL